MKRKPSELEVKAKGMAEVFSGTVSLDELKEEITKTCLCMSPELTLMVVKIERKENGRYDSAIYLNKKDLKRKYSGKID